MHYQVVGVLQRSYCILEGLFHVCMYMCDCVCTQCIYIYFSAVRLTRSFFYREINANFFFFFFFFFFLFFFLLFWDSLCPRTGPPLPTQVGNKCFKKMIEF